MNFSDALKHLKKGRQIARRVWEEEDGYLTLDGGRIQINQKDISGSWGIIHDDILAEDWIVVDE